MVQGRNYGPQVTVRRLATRGHRCKPIFVQVARQVVKMKPAELRLPSRAWKVIKEQQLSEITDFKMEECFCPFVLVYSYMYALRL